MQSNYLNQCATVNYAQSAKTNQICLLRWLSIMLTDPYLQIPDGPDLV